MGQDIENYLTEIREYLHEYKELANELSIHWQDEEYIDRLNLLEDHLIVLKHSLSTHALSEKQNLQHFLDHHFSAIQLANQHLHHLRHQTELLTVSAELETIRAEMQKLLEQIESKKHELVKEHNLQNRPNG